MLIDRTSLRFLAVGSAVALAAVTASIGAASGEPGSPGDPSDPVVLFHESFESGLDDGELTTLTAYGAGNYSADAPWLDAAAGNGLVIDGTTAPADLTAAGYANAAGQADLLELATKLGELNGSSPANLNHAVTAYTDANPGPNGVEFRTVDPLSLQADGRFLTLSANVAALNCERALAPALAFYLDDDGSETRVNDVAANPCAGAPDDNAYGAELLGGRAALFTGDAVGVIIRNEQGSGGGNDHAFDDIRVLDVTPQLDKRFVDEGSKLDPGDVTDLVLTVTNTSELGNKTGWSFVDHLPKGLKVAGDVTSTCDADVTAPSGATLVDVSSGSLAEGQASCDVTVPVTSKKGGVFKNSAANIESVGLNKPGSTSIEFAASQGADVSPSLQAPDTGEQSTPMWPVYAALLGGLALAGVGGRWLIVGRRQS